MSVDLVAAGIAEREMLGQMAAVAAQQASPAVLRGDIDTSLEEPDTRIAYRLLDGVGVRAHLPELDRLYREEFLDIAERACGYPLVTSPDLRNGVNVNVIEGTAGRYEWHFDSNPLTGLLVLTESNLQLGGRLLFGRTKEAQIALSLHVGQLLLFDARKVAHSVEPLQSNWTRLTAPMNYFAKGAPVVRPPGIDEALYGQTSTS
jgi:hypothetical protein